jgi:hypothetical protein
VRAVEAGVPGPEVMGAHAINAARGLTMRCIGIVAAGFVALIEANLAKCRFFARAQWCEHAPH